MQRHTFALTLLACACLLAPAGARADATASPAPPTASPPLSPIEARFVDMVTRDLQARFPTTTAAAAAGYFRYTGEDDTGAISWVNTSAWKSDPQHPGQLWYDANGKLIGADFTTPKTDTPPSLWGVSPARWLTQEQHVHFGVKQPDGTVAYSGYGPQTVAKFGVSMTSPTAVDVVKIGKAKTAQDVAYAFPFPAIWDLQVWLVPNPLGPFAEHNPNVKPSKTAKGQM